MLEHHSTTLKAFAKINLGLRILNKRPDGYHNIESIFHYINWFDTLIFSPQSHFSFTCSDSRLPLDESNLVVKSVRSIEKISHKPFHFHIHLEKNIPFGAGLGGGSSDAAAVFRFALLPKINFILLEEAEKAAADLGSDINFFLTPKTKIATDRGIVLEPTDFQIHAYILTVFPEIETSTKWAYSVIQPNDNYVKSYPFYLDKNLPISQYQDIFINDFDKPISSERKEIAEVKNLIKSTGAEYVSLSGSGSSVFGLFESKELAEKALDKLSKDYRCNLTPKDFAIK